MFIWKKINLHPKFCLVKLKNESLLLFELNIALIVINDNTKSTKNKRSKSKKLKIKHKSKSDNTIQKNIEIVKQPKLQERYKIISFPFDPSSLKSLNEMVNYLTIQAGRNIHDSSIIEVSSDKILTSMMRADENHRKNLLNKDTDGIYRPDRSHDNFFIRFDFKSMKAEITHYTIRTAGNMHGNMKNWIFEISDDGSNWTEIDRHVDFNFQQNAEMFKVRENKFARFCQIHQNGPPSSIQLRLWINAVEFYGRLKNPKT